MTYYSARRTTLENNISLKRVESYKTYVVTFKYKLEAGSGDVYIAPATGSTNIWHTNVYKEYTDSKLILTDNNPDVWQEGRMVFTTEDVSKIPSYERNIATLRFYALNHVHTVAYIDDIRIEEAEGDTSVKLNSNGGTFADGSTVKTQTVTVGDDITSLEYPIREDYDFGGKITMYVPGDPGYVTATGRVVEKPVYVSNGNAVLTCGRTNDKDFTFNRMSTYWNMIYQYGMIEFNIKLPEHPVHTSLWMNGASTGGDQYTALFGREDRGCMTEYDLIETYGRNNYFGTNVHHWWSAANSNDSAHISLGAAYSPEGENQTYVPDSDETDISDNYHIFTFLWTNDTLEFAFDGVKYCEYPRYYEYYDRMPNYIIIGMGMGNRDYGSAYDIEKHSDYYESYLDYVRIYQIENMGSFVRYANK